MNIFDELINYLLLGSSVAVGLALPKSQVPEFIQSFHLRRFPALWPAFSLTIHHQRNGEFRDGAKEDHHSGYPAEQTENESKVKKVEVLRVGHAPDEIGSRKTHGVSIVGEKALKTHARIVLRGSFGYSPRHVLVFGRGLLKGRLDYLCKKQKLLVDA